MSHPTLRISSPFWEWGRTALIIAYLLPSLLFAAPQAEPGTPEPVAGGELLSIGLFSPTGTDPATRRPGAVEQLLWELSKRTSVRVSETPRVISPEREGWLEALYEVPLLVWFGEGAPPTLSEQSARALNQWLRAGGLLFIDDISPPGDDRFDRGVRELVKRLWPEGALRRVEEDHTIYRSFYLLDKPYGRLARRRWLEEVRFEDLSPILYAREDTFGALGRDYLGRWRLPVSPGGDAQREYAFRFAINLLMYSTCLNYKRDQVHTLTILRRRRVSAPPR